MSWVKRAVERYRFPAQLYDQVKKWLDSEEHDK